MSPALPEVVIGIVAAPFGIKGEVKVHMETDFPDRFRDLKSVQIRLPSDEVKTVEIESVRFHQDRALVKFAGCDDMNCAETFRGGEIRIELSQLVKLPRGRYFVHDLIGMQVVTEDERDLGKVTEILGGPANDVYVTEQMMIPAVREFVREINLEERKITVCKAEALEMEEA